MKKILNSVLKVILTLLLVTPILGATGIFPAPTPEMYSTPQAYDFIAMLMEGKYIMYIEAIVFVLAIVCLWSRRTALAALLILPLTVNIVGFHLFLDGGLFTPGAVMADLLLVLNVYFLWQERKTYQPLLKGTKKA